MTILLSDYGDSNDRRVSGKRLAGQSAKIFAFTSYGEHKCPLCNSKAEISGILELIDGREKDNQGTKFSELWHPNSSVPSTILYGKTKSETEIEEFYRQPNQLGRYEVPIMVLKCESCGMYGIEFRFAYCPELLDRTTRIAYSKALASQKNTVLKIVISRPFR